MRLEHGTDQAHGLRRLLASDQRALISIVASKAGMGCSSLTTNLASALAHSGKRVMVLEENPPALDSASRLNAYVDFDLLDVAQGRCALHQVVRSEHEFSVLPAARAMKTLSRLDAAEKQRLENALIELSSEADVLLVDAAVWAGGATGASSLATGLPIMLLVVDGTSTGITESYALIKKMTLAQGRAQFRIVVTKVAHEQEARSVFNNMDKVARRHLGIRLDYFGYVPFDAKQQRATQLNKPVVEVFAASPSAQAYVELARKLGEVLLAEDVAAMDAPCMMQSWLRQSAVQASSMEMA
jgi:flagellar biosynthesis protein FlhG